MSSSRNQDGNRSPPSVIGGAYNFFRNAGEKLEVVTGDPSLSAMPYPGSNGEWKYGEPSVSSVPEKKVRDRDTYIRLDTRGKNNIDKQRCPQCKATIECRCGCCKHKGSSTKTKSKKGRKSGRGSVQRRRSGSSKDQDDNREVASLYDSVTMDEAADEAEKLGRQLAVAASMFAAGFTLVNATAQQDDDDGDGDERKDDSGELGL